MVTGTQVRIQFGSLKKMSQNERRKTCRYEKLVTTISAQGVILHIIYNTTLTFELRKLHFWRSLQKLLKTDDLAHTMIQQLHLTYVIINDLAVTLCAEYWQDIEV